tara:strand:+ start:86 stop:1087 length:1002 start_codon:yes stop_codon:yes gene_type:complete
MEKVAFNYFVEIRPNLSLQSKKLYGKQLEKIFENSKMKIFNPLKLSNRIINQSLKNKNLNMVLLNEGGLQSKNQRLSAFRNMIENNKNNIAQIKYDKIIQLITDTGNNIRNEISTIAGLNEKTPNEEINMVKWEAITNFAENMPTDSKNELRNKLILNIMVNNYKVINNQKFNVLLRIVEYNTLHLWTNKKKPPLDKINYLWLKEDPVLYIQHSKTTGGIKRVGEKTVEQVKFKTYPISNNVIKILKMYVRDFKIKNKSILFMGSDGEIMKSPYFRSILTNELKSLAPNITSTIIRKIYENREITLNNANDKVEFNKLVDHSLAVASVFYHKN